MNIETKINGVLLKTYKAELLEYEVGACDFGNGYMLPPSSMFPVKLTPTVGLRPITLQIDFEGGSMHEIEMNISKLTAVLHGGADILLPDGFCYYTVFDKVSTPKEKAPWILQAKFSLSGFRHGAMVTEKFVNGGSLFVDGNYKTPAIFKVTSQSETVAVNGITIQNMNSYPVIIDGMKKTVTRNGLNVFSDTNLTEFPTLTAGVNNFTVVASAYTELEVSYYPIYL